MNDDQLLRYARHVLLDEVGVEGQESWLGATALIVGAGGLGSPAAMYLGAAGVGRIILVDDDVVDLTNLQRQVAHTTARVDMPKVDSAALTVQAINPEIQIETVALRLGEPETEDRGRALLEQATVVLDCTDNFAIRTWLNRWCVALGKPLVSGAAIRFEGQISVYDTRYPESPCYACLFPENAEDVAPTRCATLGVFGPLVGMVGTVQAAEALKVLAGIGTSLRGRLLRVDALGAEWRSVRVSRDPACPVCSDKQRGAACRAGANPAQSAEIMVPTP